MESTAELAKIVGPLLVAEDGGQAAMTGQATLFLARDLTGKEVVLKRTTARSREQLESAQNEVSLLRKIRHPNVVAFCGVWFRPLQPYGAEINLLIELCPGGHLLDLQRRREQSGRPLTEQEIVRLFVQCCRGVECLHRFDPPVAHRDVKLENLLLGGEDGRTVKLCDFGSATTRRTLVTTKEERSRLEDEVLRLTTPSYRAPELVDFYSRKLVSEQVDVWALGCVLYALAFGKHAFGDEGSALAIIGGKFTIPGEPYYSQEFKLLFYWLLEGDPNIRPRVGDVVDELDMLLGNRVKIPAEKRGSGCGNRSSSKMAALHESMNPAALPLPTTKKKPAPVLSAASGLPPPPAARGAAFVAASPAVIPVPPAQPLIDLPTPFDIVPTVGTSSNSNNLPRGARSGAMESRRSKGNGVPPPLLGTGAPLQISAMSKSPTPPPPPPLAGSPFGGSNPNKPPSNNPFDDLLPSENPTFFSTPGLRSTSVAGFPENFPLEIPTPFEVSSHPQQQQQQQQQGSKSQSHLPFLPFMQATPGSTTNMPHASSSLNMVSFPPSQAPLFFSDPPPQWRPAPGH